jgi:ABC-2 type transport system permease protein
MNPVTHAARLGLSRGWMEFRRSVFSGQDMGFAVFFALVIVVVLFFQRDRVVEGTTLSLAMATLPSVVGMLVAMGGFSASGALTLEREDGTLLRAKALPYGMIGYLVGRLLSVSLLNLVSLLVVLIPGLFVVPELASTGWAGWLTLVWVVAFGMLATLPWGAVIGALAKNTMVLFSIVTFPMMILTAISGIFYPISALPGWLQTVAQVFPVYWLGLGVRSAFLPASAAAVEIGASWRTLETIVVLAVWALAGMLLAPPILRRMARRQSGSAVEEYRQRALQRAV